MSNNISKLLHVTQGVEGIENKHKIKDFYKDKYEYLSSEILRSGETNTKVVEALNTCDNCISELESYISDLLVLLLSSSVSNCKLVNEDEFSNKISNN